CPFLIRADRESDVHRPAIPICWRNIGSKVCFCCRPPAATGPLAAGTEIKPTFRHDLEQRKKNTVSRTAGGKPDSEVYHQLIAFRYLYRPAFSVKVLFREIGDRYSGIGSDLDMHRNHTRRAAPVIPLPYRYVVLEVPVAQKLRYIVLRVAKCEPVLCSHSLKHAIHCQRMDSAHKFDGLIQARYLPRRGMLCRSGQGSRWVVSPDRVLQVLVVNPLYLPPSPLLKQAALPQRSVVIQYLVAVHGALLVGLYGL